MLVYIPLGASETQKVSDIQLVQSNVTNIAAQNVNKVFVYISDCNLPLKSTICKISNSTIFCKVHKIM